MSFNALVICFGPNDEGKTEEYGRLADLVDLFNTKGTPVTLDFIDAPMGITKESVKMGMVFDGGDRAHQLNHLLASRGYSLGRSWHFLFGRDPLNGTLARRRGYYHLIVTLACPVMVRDPGMAFFRQQTVRDLCHLLRDGGHLADAYYSETSGDFRVDEIVFYDELKREFASFRDLFQPTFECLGIAYREMGRRRIAVFRGT
jgi:hypothetical protein